MATPTAQREERKVVTVVFADIVGSTARAESLDPEDVRAVLAPYHARLRHELERCGGTVEKFIGDAVVGVFGAPAAHEDDPERAVRAAIAIQDAIAELNEADPGLALEVRIGVNTGEALVALDARPELGEGLVSGDVINTAARLQSAAPAGGILVGEQTRRATERAIDLVEREPIEAKGKAAAGVVLARGRRAVELRAGGRRGRPGPARRTDAGGVAARGRARARPQRRAATAGDARRACPGSGRAGSSRSCASSSTRTRSSSPGAAGGRCPTARASPTGRSARS